MEKDKPRPECPRITLALIEYLEDQYPPYTPALTAPERVIFHETGKRAVVAALKREFAAQNKRE